MKDLPTSDIGLEALVNVNGFAKGYDAERWANVPLITDISCRIGDDNARTPEDAKAIYEETVSMVGPDVMFGTYISGGRVDDNMNQYPRPTVQWMPTWSYLHDHYRRVDVGNLTFAEMFAEMIAVECSERPGSIVFLDNIIHHSAMSSWPIDWSPTCRFLYFVYQNLKQYDKQLIVNIAGSPHNMSHMDRAYLRWATDGMAFEMCYHESVRNDPEKKARLIETYRYWLDKGKTVILIPGKRGEEREAEQQIVAEFAMEFRKPGDRLFIARAFWEQEREWNQWPVQKGELRDTTDPVDSSDEG